MEAAEEEPLKGGPSTAKVGEQPVLTEYLQAWGVCVGGVILGSTSLTYSRVGL